MTEAHCDIKMDNSKENIHDEENIKRYLSEVKLRLESQNVSIPSHCDQFIIRCLRVKNFNIEKTAQLLMNFESMMRTRALQDLFAKFKPSELKDIYFNGTISPLLKRNSLGQLIVAVRACSWNANDYDFDEILAAFIVLLTYAVAQSNELQSSGLVIVVDFSGWTLQQIRSVKISRLQMSVKFMQSSCPMKIKGIHLIHHPRVIAILYQLLKPLLKAKLVGRIHFHREEDSLNKVFGSQFFAETFPGKDNARKSSIDNDLLMDLVEKDEYCKEMVKCGYPSY